MLLSRSASEMPPTFPWSPLPSEGDTLKSTCTLFIGHDIEDTSLIARLITEGYRINDVKVLTLDEERGCVLVSLWRDANPRIKKISRVPSSRTRRIDSCYAPVLGGAIQVRAYRRTKRSRGSCSHPDRAKQNEAAPESAQCACPSASS